MDVILKQKAYINGHCEKGQKATVTKEQFDESLMVKVPGLEPEFNQERKELIIEMLNDADHTDDAQWTKLGKISMKYIEEILNDATREEVEAALPGFNRKQ